MSVLKRSLALTLVLGLLWGARVPVCAQETGLGNEPGSDINRPIRDKWALVVGIGTFATKKIPQLKYATKDARDFYNYLLKDGHFAPDHVRILLDDKATERRIMSELGSKFLARLAKPDDLIVVFFSTHGSPSQMDLRGRNYLVAYDTDPEDLFATGIEMQKILEAIQGRVLTDRVLLVMDACHSGSTNPNAKGIVRSANFDAAALAEGSGQLVICSSKPDEQSWESKRYQNGVFTRNLLEGLKSKPNCTLAEAFDKAHQLIADEVQEDYPGARQTPVLHSKWTGNELVISVLPKQPQVVPQTVILDLEPDSARPAEEKTTGAVDLNKGRSPERKPQGVLVLTSGYFCNEKNPRAAYSEACAQQAAHFNEPAYYFRKVKVLIQLGNFSKADQELKGLLVDNPNNSDYHLARAYCYHRLGNKMAALDHLTMAQFHNPTLPKEIQFGD